MFTKLQPLFQLWHFLMTLKKINVIICQYIEMGMSIKCSIRKGAISGICLCFTVLLAYSQVSDNNKPKATIPVTLTGENQTEKLPLIIPDESSKDWVVDRCVGNNSAGPVFFQGQALEAGVPITGIPSLAVAPDGRLFFIVSEGIAEVYAEGMMRLVVSRQEWRADGLDDFYHRGGLLAWNPKENCLYFWGKNCIRRLVEKPDGTRAIEVVVGSPGKPGRQDGPAEQATLTSIGNICINSQGTVFFYDMGNKNSDYINIGATKFFNDSGNQYGDCLRKLENGIVSTITDNMRTLKYKDGPLKTACFNFINLGGLNSIGENDEVLYLADHWNGIVRRIDLKTENVTTVAGRIMSHEDGSFNRQGADGPALTHSHFISGCTFSVYDPVHNAVWCGGPDETRLRWLKDGWIKTVMGQKIRGGSNEWGLNDLNVPIDSVSMAWTWVLAVDRKGGAYVYNGVSRTGFWRLYNKNEALK
jgi:hypothetical protein